MQILINPNKRELIIEHKGEEVRTNYSVWAKLTDRTNEDIFGPTNEYMATLPLAVQDKMFGGFVKTAELFSHPNELKDVKASLIEYARTITEDLTDEHLMDWCVKHGEINVEPSPRVLTNKTPAAMTYTEQESFELSSFCVVAKILTPLLGRYVDEVKGAVHNMHKERSASIIFTETNLVNFKAYKRLKLYLEVLAARKQNSIPMALRFGTASADMDKYLIGLTIVRRLTMARVRTSKDGAIVAFIYKFLEEKIDELGKKTYRTKFDRDDDSSEAGSYADQFRIPEEVARHAITTTELYLVDLPLICSQLTDAYPALTYADVNDRYMELSSNTDFVITNSIHYPLVALILRKHIHHRMIDKVSLDACLSAIAIAATVCKLKGFDDIESLLMAQRKEKSLTDLNFNTQNGRAFRRLPKEIDLQLRDLYKYVPSSYKSRGNTPARELIEKVVGAILGYDWERAKGGFIDQSSIRQSIAELILTR